MAVHDGHLAVAPSHEASDAVAVAARERAVEEAVDDGELSAAARCHDASVGGVAVDGAADVDRRAAVLDDGVAVAPGRYAANELLAARDGAGGVQIADGGVAHTVEGSNVLLVVVLLVVGQRVAVAVEGTTVGGTVGAAIVTGGDVGTEHGVDIVLALGVLHALAEGVPVGRRGDAHGVGQVPRAQRRGAGIDIHTDVVLHAGAREVDGLLAGVALVLRQFVGLGVNQFAGVVTHGDLHHQFGAAVPHGVRFAAIFPVDADTIGPLVGERGGVVLQTQQV